MDETPPQWFVSSPPALADVLRAAAFARENSGKRQFIHHHPHGAECTADCWWDPTPGEKT